MYVVLREVISSVVAIMIPSARCKAVSCVGSSQPAARCRWHQCAERNPVITGPGTLDHVPVTNGHRQIITALSVLILRFLEYHACGSHIGARGTSKGHQTGGG